MIPGIKNKRIIVYDFETNGEYNKLTQPTQVAMRILHPKRKLQLYKTFIKCPYRIPDNIIDVNGITNEMLDKEGVELKVAFEKIRDIIFEDDNFLLVGHWILRFDNQFLNYYLQRFFTNRFHVPKEKCYDTFGQYKAKMLGVTKPNGKSFGEFHHQMAYNKTRVEGGSLPEVCQHYGVPLLKHHRADNDAEMAHGIFNKQMEELAALEQEKLPNRLYKVA